ncbi:hypothetical protein Q7C36_004701 [Tachysurus vachellii]|uniref:Uncharacterized protein n=1 Tax=Tachysurus vachellii TaxID=175792 RepID=A0AA88T1W1_TACVA|nr:hypothetical protein Q7C36_004701 [Tachysurus vachellii]
MEGYGVSDEELFASSLHNFTWENSFEQQKEPGGVELIELGGSAEREAFLQRRATSLPLTSP